MLGPKGLQVSRALGDLGLDSILFREPDIFRTENPVWVMVASDGLVDGEALARPGKRGEFEEYILKHLPDANTLMRWARG